MDNSVAYLAPEGYEEELSQEIQGITARYDRLFLTDRPIQKTFWAQNIWFNPFVAQFNSISEAAKILKNIQRNWSFYPFTEFRRAALIQEQLPYLSKKPLPFPTPLPTLPLGSWTLLDKNTLLASPHCSSPFPNGQILFEECKEGPPSRAYLKLWEALTLMGVYPKQGEKCLEIGASPGGWTWVLAQLGAEVTCIDRSELAPHITALPNVHFTAGNAFNMTPANTGPVDWIFSDVACYPEKLLDWVNLWLESGLCKHFVCTLKFQTGYNPAIVDQFAKIPGSKILHLSHNKHELTWFNTHRSA